jgi:hypothetical protein
LVCSPIRRCGGEWRKPSFPYRGEGNHPTKNSYPLGEKKENRKNTKLVEQES